MKSNSILIMLSFLIISMVFFTDSAFAYLDPGSGSMMLQLLFGGIAGVAVIIKLYWRSFMSLFRRNGSQNETPPHQERVDE